MNSIIRFHFVLFLITSLSSSAKDYIVGGQVVGPNDPVQASTVGLFSPSRDGQSGSLCTASVIRNGIAVTAAHCVQPGTKPVLIFGRDLHSPQAVKRNVRAVAVNPDWKTKAGHGMDQGDIALVKFGGRIPEGYQKIPTLNSDKSLSPGETTTLAGFGISNAQTHEGAGLLRKAQVKIVDSRRGKTEMILSQSHGRGACHGDSGGPAFVSQKGKTVLAGVTNRGYPDSAPDDCAHQVVYTKVPAYKNWIHQTEKALDHAKPVRGEVAYLSKNHFRLARKPRMQKASRFRAARKGHHA